MNKGELRRHFRTQVQNLGEQEIELSSQVSRFVSGYLRAENVQAPIGCFKSLPGEPNLDTAILELEDEGFELAFPVITGESLHFYKPHSGADWAQGPYGIREPNPKRAHEIPLPLIHTLLIPGVAFDQRGARLGRGKGYYDRALQNFKGTKVGVAFSRQLSKDELPVEGHDVRMDLIITENGVHFTSPEGRN